MQYPHHAYIKPIEFLLLDFFANSIPNVDDALQKVLLPMQNEHGNEIEENEWVHEGSRRCCKVHACISFYVGKWLFHRHLDQTHGFQMQLGRFRHPSTCLGGFKQQDHIFMNVEQLTCKAKME
jgi:hypothetical protein